MQLRLILPSTVDATVAAAPAVVASVKPLTAEVVGPCILPVLSVTSDKFSAMSKISPAVSLNWNDKSLNEKDENVFNNSILPCNWPKNWPIGPGNNDKDENKSLDLAVVLANWSWISPCVLA